LTIFLYPSFASITLTAALLRLLTNKNIPHIIIVCFVLPEHFTFWMLPFRSLSRPLVRNFAKYVNRRVRSD